MIPFIGPNSWRVIFGVLAAIDAYLLSQPDVTLEPIVKVVLGAIAVGLAVLNPTSIGTKSDTSAPPPRG